MKFEPNKVYCLYNSGNNFETIFFSKRNRNYFLRKIDKFIKPFAKIVHVFLPNNQFYILIETKKDVKLSLLNKNIGIMLSSYTQGVNKEQNRLGSLFRAGTKAINQVCKFPWFIRRKLQEFREFFKPGRLVKFKETVKHFLLALRNDSKSQDHKLNNLKLSECLMHPLKIPPI